MTLGEFDKLTKAELASLLGSWPGFQFQRGMLHRETATGVRHAVLLDFNMRSKRAFRVMVGLNHRLLTPGISPAPAGIFAMSYLGGGGLGTKAVAFAAQDTATARHSLARVLGLVQAFALPWFEGASETREAALRVEPLFPFTKGKLFALAGSYEEAEFWVRKHLAELSSRPQSEAVEQAIWETNGLLREIAAHRA